MNPIELSRSLVSIDSSLSHGTRDITEYISQLAFSTGLRAEVFNESYNGVENSNIVIRTQNNIAERDLLLISRIDTLDPGEYATWVRTGANPYNASVDGELIYGLGITDAKADFACKFNALKQLNGNDFGLLNPVLVGTFGPSSGVGAIRLIRKKAVKPDFVLAGGPTDLKIATRGPGYAKVEITLPFTKEEMLYNEQHNLSEASVSQTKIFTKTNGATSVFDLYDNVFTKMISYLKNLPEGISILNIEMGSNSETDPDLATLEIDINGTIQNGILAKLIKISDSINRLSAELKNVVDDKCIPKYSTLNVGMVRTFPEQIKILGICRLVPARGRNIYEGWIEKLRHDCAATGAGFNILDYKPPFEVDTEGTFLQQLKSVSSEVGVSDIDAAASACTEANVFQRLGVPSVVFGPGESTQKNGQAQEHVKIKDLVTAENFYKKAIERLCK